MFKFLDPSGCTIHEGEAFPYNLPGRGQKWATTDHPAPVAPDGEPCGPGRLHLMKALNATNAPRHWWAWWARGVGEPIGEDEEKAAFAAVQLRRIPCAVFWRMLRPPFNWGFGANLRGADLRDADLRDANLRGANLRDADLRDAIWNRFTLWSEGFEPQREEQGQCIATK